MLDRCIKNGYDEPIIYTAIYKSLATLFLNIETYKNYDPAQIDISIDDLKYISDKYSMLRHEKKSSANSIINLPFQRQGSKILGNDSGLVLGLALGNLPSGIAIGGGS